MHRAPRPDGLLVDTSNPQSAHAFDRASMSPSFSLASTPGISPEPAYIAAAAASNVATSEIVSEFELEDRDFEGAAVTSGSLALINAFLDRLLFNFLACARATTLAALRPAVVEVLKPRLAKEAIDGADEELHEYLGTDDEEFAADDAVRTQAAGDWDMDLVWKRTRLRCMVYTRLGDMEEEDEDMLLDDNASDSARPSATVSPAVAIFLTAVLEHVAEHALGVAAQAAFIRVETRARIENHQTLRRILVEEGDMEKVALNSTLGRLWRAWRKLVRSPHSPRSSVSRMSRDGGATGRLRGLRTTSTSRKTSVASLDGRPFDAAASTTHTPSVAEVLDEPEPEPDPCAVPLPLTDHDVAEIEVPNYSPALTQKNRTVDGGLRYRPYSLYHPEATTERTALDPSAIEDDGSETSTPRAAMLAFPGRRLRSSSLPTPQTPFFVLPDHSETDSVFATPVEEVPPREWAAESEQELAASRSEGGGVAQTQKGLSPEKERTFTVPSKPSSAPSSPYHGSVLNVLSRQVARDFEVQTTKQSQPRRPSELQALERESQSEVDPADGPLQFGSDDYKIDDSERAAAEAAAAAAVTAREQAPPAAQPKTRHRPPRLPLQKPSTERVTEAKAAASSPPPPVTPRNFSKPTLGARTGATGGDVSPIGQASIHSGEVSPIESGDEVELEDATPVIVSPLMQRSFQPSPPRVSAAAPPLPAGSTSAGTQRAPVGPERPRRRGGPTEDDYVKEEKREAYVLPEEYSAPTNGNAAPGPGKRSVEHPTAAAALTNKELPPIEPAAATKKRFQSPAEPGIAPNLAPLRELMDAAPDTSDEASSLAPSQADRPTRATSASPANVGPTSAPGSAINLDSRRQMPQPALSKNAVNAPRAVSSATEPTRPTRSMDSHRRKGSGAHHESTLSHASSDGSRSDGYSKSSSSPRAPQKTFDQLISSGETLSYTLTPQHMREIKGHDSPTGSIMVAKPQPSSPVSPRVSIERSNPKSSRLGQSTGYSSSKPDSPLMGGAPPHPQHMAPTSGPSFVIQPGPAVKRGPQPVPREARTDQSDTSTRDFADFIRSTGPDGPAPAASQGAAAAPTARGGPVPRAPRKDGQLATAPTSAMNRMRSAGGHKPRLQAREPVVRANGTADLVQFLNSGPPGESGRPSSDRTAADLQRVRNITSLKPNAGDHPSGLTLGSKDGAGVGVGGERRATKDSNSVSSAHDSFAAHSFVSSNSRTGLLETNKAAATKISPHTNGKRPAHGPSPTSLASDMPGLPPRKQRRVRDPYAIDSDSDEEGNGDAIVGPGRKGGSGRQEESLIDFLNSVPPPEANNSPPRLDIPKSTLKSLGRKGGSSASARTSGGKVGLMPRSKPVIPPSDAGSLDAGSQGGGAGAPRGNTVAAAGNGYSGTNPGLRYQPSPQSTTSASGYRSSPSGRGGDGTTPTRSRGSMRPRTAREDESGLRELASFLKNSGPPELPEPKMSAPQQNGKEREDGGGFSRMFSRRKKATATA